MLLLRKPAGQWPAAAGSPAAIPAAGDAAVEPERGRDRAREREEFGLQQQKKKKEMKKKRGVAPSPAAPSPAAPGRRALAGGVVAPATHGRGRGSVPTPGLKQRREERKLRERERDWES